LALASSNKGIIIPELLPLSLAGRVALGCTDFLARVARRAAC